MPIIGAHTVVHPMEVPDYVGLAGAPSMAICGCAFHGSRCSTSASLDRLRAEPPTAIHGCASSYDVSCDGELLCVVRASACTVAPRTVDSKRGRSDDRDFRGLGVGRRAICAVKSLDLAVPVAGKISPSLFAVLYATVVAFLFECALGRLSFPNRGGC
jgi:hypothetical protein